jgi:ketosteroid isomerase-like protein
MHPNAKIIQTFYERFRARDGEGMAACYAPDVVFSDPVFPRLEGERAGAMWKMLTGRAADLDITFDGITADDTKGSANWTARYTFSQTGRPVVNVIRASFRFANGKIVQHDDLFDFWKWSRQALGPIGLLLGWSPIVRRKVQTTAGAALEKYVRERRPPEA